MRLVCLLLLSLAILSCGGESISCELALNTEAQVIATHRAASKWDAHSTKPFHFISGGDWLIVAAPIANGIIGHTELDRHLVRVDPTLSDARFYRVVFHEMGHVLGIWDHTSRGVMRDPVESDELSDEDLSACNEAGSC